VCRLSTTHFCLFRFFANGAVAARYSPSRSRFCSHIARRSLTQRSFSRWYYPAVVLTALLNPAVIVVAFWMGRNADQWQKLPVAAFAGALAGSIIVYLAVRVGIARVAGVGRATAGVFIAEFLFGLIWACLGYRFGRRRL